HQQNVNLNLNYAGQGWSSYLNIAADRQNQGFPAGLPSIPNSFPFTLATPRASNTPLDYGDKQGANFVGGVTATIAPGVEMIADGGIRRKFQQAAFFNYFNNPLFVYDVPTAVPSSFVDTTMTTTSFTPRFDISQRWFGIPNRLLTGIDFYNTQYSSDRPV